MMRSGFRKNSKRRGFGLVETAIIVSIAGFILGAIWVVGQRVWVNNEVRAAIQQLAATAQNTRAAYAEQGGIAGAAAALTPALDQLRVFPLEMRQTQANPTGILFHPFSSRTNVVGGVTLGSVQIAADDCTGTEGAAVPQPCFGVLFTNLSQRNCNDLAVKASSPAGGLQRVLINLNPVTIAGDAGVGTLPVLPSRASALCNLATDTNTLLWIYLLRDNKS